jgi:hypothetical protein
MKTIKLNNIEISESLNSCIYNKYISNDGNDVTSFVGISSNGLIMINNFPITNKADYTYLLNGNDKDMLVLQGSLECITNLIHKCFDIRDSNTSAEFRFENYNKLVIFQ